MKAPNKTVTWHLGRASSLALAVLPLCLAHPALAQATADQAAPPAPTAQQAPAATPAPAPASSSTAASNQQVITLSPFEIDASKDQGYYAPNTLAGTRINTDLKDLSAPITVVTKQFMTDIGATNVNDILTYEVGSESTKDFSATQGELGRTTDGAAQDPTASQRGRGLAPYDITRDYFYSLAEQGASSLSTGGSVGFDPYNLDEITVSRGPNSILAGLGSPAGIINFSPQTANLVHDSNEISYRFGSFGDQRATLNSNVVAQDGKLAFRVAGAYSDAGFKQQPAYRYDRRYYVAGTWQPFSGTTIHGSYEAVRVSQDLPNTFTPEDDVSQWLALGKPSFTTGQAAPAPAGIFLGQGGNEPTVYFNPDRSIYKAYNSGAQYGFAQENLANVGIWQPLRMSNNQYGNWQNMNTSASNALNTLDTVSVSIDQHVFEGFDINAAAVREILHSNQINLFRPDYVQYGVDVNTRLPNGTPNPYYGDTFMYFRGLDNSQNTKGTNQVARAQGTYTLDLDKYNKWFGKYNLIGFVETRKTDVDFLDYNIESTDTGANSPALYNETARSFYLGGSAANGYKAQTVPFTPYLFTGLPYANANGATGDFSDAFELKEEDKNLTKLDTSAVVMQGFLLDGLVVPTFGIRNDVDNAGFVVGNTTNPATGLIGRAGGYGPLARVQAQTKSYGVVVHGYGPLSWMSLFYNYSENFIPNAGSIDLTGTATPDPTGVSREGGMSVSLLNNRLNAKVDFYKTVAANSADPSVNFPLVQWSIPFMYLGSGGVVGPMQDLANQAGVKLQSPLAPSIVTGDPRLANAYTADQQAEGMEFELTYNITKNWRLFGTVTKDQAEADNIATKLTTLINAQVAYWQATPGLWTGKTTTHDWSGAPETGQQVFNDDVLGPFIAYQAASGQPSQQLHKWKETLVTDYTFDEGFLKNINIGTGLRFLDKTIIGNPAIYSLVNGTQTVTGLDLAHPYTTPAQGHVDAWIGYKTRFFNKYLVTFQLRGEDLQSPGSYLPVAANSDGTHAVFTIVQPRTFFFTTTIDF